MKIDNGSLSVPDERAVNVSCPPGTYVKEEKDRICLRKIKDADLEKIMHWRMLPEVTRYLHTDPQITIDEQKRWFKKNEYDETCIYRIIQVNEEDIGIFALIDIDKKNRRTNRLWYIADDHYKGRGIGSSIQAWCNHYIFDVLQLNRSYSEVFADNEANIRLNLKGGYECEGTLKQHVYKNGVFHDIVILGLIKDKWDTIKQNDSYRNVEFEE